jgi:hypothetical protein
MELPQEVTVSYGSGVPKKPGVYISRGIFIVE